MGKEVEPAPAQNTLRSLLFWTAFFAVPYFLAAGDLWNWQGWIFVLVNWISILYVQKVVYQKYPDLLNERREAGVKTKDWDRRLVIVLVAILPMLTAVVAGLDYRYQWTGPWPQAGVVAGLALYFIGSGWVVAAMSANRFFSSHYRIQGERNHQVADTGPYRWVRHPSYLGMIMASVGLPLFWGSWPALGLGLTSASLIVLRTALEDRSLQVDLPGYAEYSQRVPDRLFPWIW